MRVRRVQENAMNEVKQCVMYKDIKAYCCMCVLIFPHKDEVVVLKIRVSVDLALAECSLLY